MRLLSKVCKLLKGLIDDRQRCLAWAGLTWGAISVGLSGVLIAWGFIDHASIPVIAPLLRDLALAQVALIGVVVLNLPKRKFSATIGSNSISLGDDEGSDDVTATV